MSVASRVDATATAILRAVKRLVGAGLRAFVVLGYLALAAAPVVGLVVLADDSGSDEE